MLKRLLSPIVGVLVAGNVFSQDIFSYYFPTNKSVSTSVLYAPIDPTDEDIAEGVSFERSRETITDAYIRNLDDRVGTSKASIYRTYSNGGEYNIPGVMSKSLADTFMEECHIGVVLKKFADDLKKKATIERKFNVPSISSSNDSAKKDHPYKLILRPAIRGLQPDDFGLEFVLKDAEKDSLAMARLYYNRADLRVPLGNLFKSDEKGSKFNSVMKKVSLSARFRYGDENSGSAVISYETEL